MNGENRKKAIKMVEKLLVELLSGKVKCLIAVVILEDSEDGCIQEIGYMSSTSLEKLTLAVGALEIHKQQMVQQVIEQC